jgi:hypothetical protein
MIRCKLRELLKEHVRKDMLMHTYTLKWNFKVESFVVQYFVQKEEDMHMCEGHCTK